MSLIVLKMTSPGKSIYSHHDVAVVVFVVGVEGEEVQGVEGILLDDRVCGLKNYVKSDQLPRRKTEKSSW